MFPAHSKGYAVSLPMRRKRLYPLLVVSLTQRKGIQKASGPSKEKITTIDYYKKKNQEDLFRIKGARILCEAFIFSFASGPSSVVVSFIRSLVCIPSNPREVPRTSLCAGKDKSCFLYPLSKILTTAVIPSQPSFKRYVAYAYCIP